MKEREKIEVGPTIECGCGCGTRLEQFDDHGRERCYINGHNARALWREVKTLRAAKATSPRSQ